MKTEEIMQALYASEINASIYSFWDSGWHAGLGDDLNDYKAETTKDTFAEAVEWLAEQAVKFYPESKFAKDWKK